MLADGPGYVASRPMSDENLRPEGPDAVMRSRILVDRSVVGLGQWSLSAMLRRVTELDASDLDLRERLHRDVPALRRIVGAAVVLEANEAFLGILGAQTVAELTTRLPELVTADSAALYAELVAALADGQRRIERAGTLSRLDGVPVRVAIGIVVGEDDPDLGVVSMTDLAKFGNAEVAQLEHRRRAEELERMSFEIDRLFYAVSHDLRAPLRGVANLAAWIEEDLVEGKEEEVRQHVATLQGRVARMDDMLSAVLDYAKVGGGETVLESVDVGSLLEELAGDEELVPRGFGLEWEAMPTLVTQIAPLRSVLVRLVDNAVKHHDREEGTVTITSEDAGELWRFRVADDGPGIPHRYRERVFHLFATLRRRDEVEGSGMGLAVVQKIVVSQGGNIAVEDAEPRGSAFVFTWPKVSRDLPDDGAPQSVRPGRLT